MSGIKAILFPIPRQRLIPNFEKQADSAENAIRIREFRVILAKDSACIL